MSRDEVLNKLRTVGVHRALDLSPPELVAAFITSMEERNDDSQAVAAAFLQFRTEWLARGCSNGMGI
jgi:hypothetical protein